MSDAIKEARDYSKIIDQIATTMKRGGAALTEHQRLLLAGAVAVHIDHAVSTLQRENERLREARMQEGHGLGCQCPGAADKGCIWDCDEECLIHPQKDGCPLWKLCECNLCTALNQKEE